MTSNAGVWIDHKKAVIIRIQDGVEKMHSIDSGMEHHVRNAGRSCTRGCRVSS